MTISMRLRSQIRRAAPLVQPSAMKNFSFLFCADKMSSAINSTCPMMSMKRALSQLIVGTRSDGTSDCDRPIWRQNLWPSDALSSIIFY